MQLDLDVKRIFFGARLSHWNTRRYCFKRSLCGSWLWKAFESKEPWVLNKVYVCGKTDQPFTFSWVECKLLASGEIALLTLASLQCCRHSLLPILQQSHYPQIRSGLFVSHLIWIPCKALCFTALIKLWIPLFHTDIVGLRQKLLQSSEK